MIHCVFRKARSLHGTEREGLREEIHPRSVAMLVTFVLLVPAREGRAEAANWCDAPRPAVRPAC